MFTANFLVFFQLQKSLSIFFLQYLLQKLHSEIFSLENERIDLTI